MIEKYKEKTTTKNNVIPWWIKSIVLLAFTGVISYKLITSTFNFLFDFSSFLSLLMALFSIVLSALFYFKATETSNSFYDNTYKFTQEIAGLLVKIESGFGEKLNHLGDAYKGMQKSFDQLPNRIEIKDAKMELKKEEETVENLLKEKDNIIEELVNKAQLSNDEKKEVIDELKSKDIQLTNAQREIIMLNRKLRRYVSTQVDINIEELNKDMVKYFQRKIVSRIDPADIFDKPRMFLVNKIRQLMMEQPAQFARDMENHGLLTEDMTITKKGIELTKKLSEKNNLLF